MIGERRIKTLEVNPQSYYLVHSNTKACTQNNIHITDTLNQMSRVTQVNTLKKINITKITVDRFKVIGEKQSKWNWFSNSIMPARYKSVNWLVILKVNTKFKNKLVIIIQCSERSLQQPNLNCRSACDWTVGIWYNSENWQQ